MLVHRKTNVEPVISSKAEGKKEKRKEDPNAAAEEEKFVNKKNGHAHKAHKQVVF